MGDRQGPRTDRPRGEHGGRHRNGDGGVRHDVHQDRSLGTVYSALGLRLGLAIIGLLASVAGLVATTVVTRHLGWTVFFGVLVAVTAVNIAVVSVRLAQRARYRRKRTHEGSGREV